MEPNKHNLRETISETPSQLEYEPDFFNQLLLRRQSFNKVIICGLGGSALLGDFLIFFKEKKMASLAPSIPVIVHRSYGLPVSVDENSLIICISYSGNTEETISAFEAAKEKGLEIAGIACGGKLADLCQENKCPWVKLPDSPMPPRYSTGYQLRALIKILMAYGLLTNPPHAEFKALAEKISPRTIENEAKLKAAKLLHKIPVVYASGINHILAYLWKIDFNENAKVPSFYNSFPELNHNEINGWSENAGGFYFLMLQDPEDHPRIIKRMEITAQLMKDSGMNGEMIKIQGDNALEKLFWVSIYGHFLAYHLSLIRGVDPFPVPIVDELKKRLAK